MVLVILVQAQDKLSQSERRLGLEPNATKAPPPALPQQPSVQPSASGLGPSARRQDVPESVLLSGMPATTEAAEHAEPAHEGEHLPAVAAAAAAVAVVAAVAAEEYDDL